MIPKIIYQTWKTQNLPKKLYFLHQKMLKQNPEYQQIIYTDEQMNDYINSNAEKEIKTLYWRLNNIVARSDIWRYTILLEKGGIYLDIDSLITGSLDNVINDKDEAIITAEKNKNLFVQWALVFNKDHPILEETLINILRDVKKNNFQFDHHSLTVKNYAKAIYTIFQRSNNHLNWDQINENTNELISFDNTNVRIFGVDYNEYFLFKHKFNHLLRNRKPGTELKTHWSIQEKINPVYE